MADIVHILAFVDVGYFCCKRCIIFVNSCLIKEQSLFIIQFDFFAPLYQTLLNIVSHHFLILCYWNRAKIGFKSKSWISPNVFWSPWYCIHSKNSCLPMRSPHCKGNFILFYKIWESACLAVAALCPVFYQCCKIWNVGGTCNGKHSLPLYR